MRFICSREQLVQAISTVERAVPTRDVDDSLKGILLEAQQERLQLTAFDLQLGIECTAPAQVEQQGTIMVDARLFSQLTRKLPGQQVEFSYEPGAGAATVRSGRAEFTINTRDASDFPKLPDADGDVVWTIDRGVLRDMIRQTVFAAAVDDHRSYLNGVLFEVEGDRLNMVATDTNRLAYRIGQLEAEVPSQHAIVPARGARASSHHSVRRRRYCRDARHGSANFVPSRRCPSRIAPFGRPVPELPASAASGSAGLDRRLA